MKLIDFGYATRYIDESSKKHIKNQRLDEFRGNGEFASVNQLNLNSTSRRDDLISLYYLLVYILKIGNTPGFNL